MKIIKILITTFAICTGHFLFQYYFADTVNISIAIHNSAQTTATVTILILTGLLKTK